MSRVILKERQFEPTGNNLGAFEAKDLETFDLQYTDTDEPQEESSGSSSQSSHVPQPKDENPLDREQPQSKNQNQSGSGSSDQNQDQDGGDSDGEQENNIPDEWDPYGENLDDQDPDMPEPNQGNSQGSGGSGGSSEEDEDEEEPYSGQRSQDGGLDQTGSSGGSSQDSEGEEEEGDFDSSGSGDEDEYDNEEDEEGGNSSKSSSQSKNSSKSDDGQDGEDSSNGENPLDREQPQSKNQNQSGSGSSDQNQDQDGGDSDGEGDSSSSSSSSNRPTNSSSKGSQQSDPSSDYGVDDDADYSGTGREPTEEELEQEDEDFDLGTLSDLEKALQKIKETSTESSKSRQKSTNERAEKEDSNSEELRNNKNRQEEISAAKDILGKALQDTKEKEPSTRKKDDDDDEDNYDRDSDSAEDILGSLGAGNLTTLFNPSTLSDWRARLTKLFDKALGFDIVTNPNLVNKKIEDAPPGREDEIPVIKNVVILLDLSSSMGSTEFKQVISHVDTMLRARKMNNTWFHIVAFGDRNIKTIEPYYTKCKGSQFKTKIMAGQYLHGIWMTDLVPGIILAATKVHHPDAVIIMTDAGFNGGGRAALEKDSKAKMFMKKNKSKIIWALTTNFSKEGVNQFDPTALSQKRYVRFKKSK